MIIFNDSISKFYQCSIWGFCQGISMFFSICFSKKIAKVIKLLGIWKKYVSKNKIIFCSRNKSNVSPNKVILSFIQISNLISLCRSFTVLSTDVYVHISYFFCSLILISKKWNIETMLTFPDSYSCEKLTTTKWMKKEAKSIRVWILNM